MMSTDNQQLQGIGMIAGFGIHLIVLVLTGIIFLGYPFAKAYVQSGLGFGVSGGVTLEHWSGRWIMRSASYANWVRNTAHTDWTQTFITGYVPAVIHQGRYGSVANGHDIACGVALRMSVSGDRASRTSLYEDGVI